VAAPAGPSAAGGCDIESRMRTSSAPLLAAEVREALAASRPVVALETTLVTHGLPHPQGLETAAEMETAVRSAGAVPATIGVLDGVVRVGLPSADLSRLAASGAVKLNLSNFAAQMATGGTGSTTVAATMLVAHRAGIEVFATGGIGGVHRNVNETGDISADLTALSRFAVAVVCAGAKAVLDLGRTLEALETLGVPVLGLRTHEFPAFYRRTSGYPLDAGFEDVESLARAVRTHFELGTGTGIVVANPVPQAHELPEETYEAALAQALAAAAREGVRGRAVTPFLLDHLRTVTEGASLFSNRALLLHNAQVAAQLARALAAARPAR
jgi:pseudouridylate synthase